jgi:hypothetical protein
MENVTSFPLHETIGMYMGEDSGCLVLVQSRGVAPGFSRCDQMLAIPMVSILRLESLETGDAIYP